MEFSRGAMAKKIWVLVAVIALCAGVCSAQNAKATLQAALKTMGDVQSIRYSGTGKFYAFGQSFQPTSAWPATNLTSYTKTIDYNSKSAKEELTRVEPNPPLPGGGRPFGGEDKQVNFVSGPYAWDQPRSAPIPQMGAAGERQLQIWLTPNGFLKAAMENNATAKKGPMGTVISFKTGTFTVNGTIDSKNFVTRTETRVPNPVLGDMLVETVFSGYKDFGGVKFPSMIMQKQGGFPVLELNVTRVDANPGLAVVVPDSVRTASAPQVRVVPQKLADGVWFMGGGSHNSVLVEFPTYLAMIEGPQGDARSRAVMAEAAKLVPGKPIKYLINSHHHFDHLGGVRAYVAAGATIITNEMNVPFYEKIFTAPHTLAPDELAKNPRKAEIIPVKEKYVLSEGRQSIEIYHVDGDFHNADIQMMYLPKDKILVEADDFTPDAPGVPAPTGIRPKIFAKNLNKQLQRLKLDVVTIAPLHGIVVPFSDFKKAVGD
jgi:glyoxylase-like metal-dependent hydrolase (beta-lactamase superfamily II)